MSILHFLPAKMRTSQLPYSREVIPHSRKDTEKKRICLIKKEKIELRSEYRACIRPDAGGSAQEAAALRARGRPRPNQRETKAGPASPHAREGRSGTQQRIYFLDNSAPGRLNTLTGHCLPRRSCPANRCRLLRGWR